jgi:hypothetical protein
MKNIQNFLALILLFIVISIGSLYILFKNSNKQKTTTINPINPINLKYIDNKFYKDFYNYTEKNGLDQNCINCLYNILSSKYTYEDFNNFLYLSIKNNEDPSIDLSQNPFALDFFKYGKSCGCN